MFVACRRSGGYTMGLFRWQPHEAVAMAKEFTLADNFFIGGLRGSYLNTCGSSARAPQTHKDARRACGQARCNGRQLRSQTRRRPAKVRCRLTAAALVGSSAGRTTRQYHANPLYQPSGNSSSIRRSLDLADAKGTERLGVPLPPQTEQNDRRHAVAKGINWAWYAVGEGAIADGRRPPDEKRKVSNTARWLRWNFQPHIQPSLFPAICPGDRGSRPAPQGRR